ncbi:unnamed protein product [Lactuca saligna]|uniref:Uncharacterized protein n=1 Tax=Lactuca saligna TaxID=75948 RepID=A0AA35Y8F8_LACSI|nr:unnamed protein product [Lactuca saligna]
MMILNPFVVIFFGVLICTIDIIYGRNIDREETRSLEHVESTSRTGCSTSDKECGGEHEDITQTTLDEKHGVMYGQGTTQSYVGDDHVRSNNDNKNVNINVNENGYHIKNNDSGFCIGYCNMIINNTTNIDSNNGSNNVIGSGSNNGNINGSSNTNGTDNIPGSGNNDPIIVSIGQNNGNGNANVNPGSGGRTNWSHTNQNL